MPTEVGRERRESASNFDRAGSADNRSSSDNRRSLEQPGFGKALKAATGTVGREEARKSEASSVGRASLELGRASNELQRKRAKDFEDQVKSAAEGKRHEKKEEEHVSVNFVEAPMEGLTQARAEELLKEWGPNCLPEKHTPKWIIFLRLLIGPMPIMLWIASLIELIIGNYADMAILLVIQFVNAFISFYETTKAGDAVAALKKSLKPEATCKRNGEWRNMDATQLVPGDRVLLAAGSAIPADCYCCPHKPSEIIEVDQSAMTGESLPVKFRRGDICKLGSTVVRGEVEGTVETTGANTFFGKTATMLQAGGTERGSLETLLLNIMLILVTLSLSLCITALIYLIVEGRRSNANRPANHQKQDNEIVKESLSFAVVVLIASIPLAIEIVTTTTLALGSKVLSSKGAIVTRLGAIEEMAGMDMLCSDKTGTLTLNKMVLEPEDCAFYEKGETYDTVVMQAALAAKWKEPPRDALDTMVLVTSKQDLKKCDEYEQIEFEPFDPRNKYTKGRLRDKGGNIFEIMKGAPHVLLDKAWNKDELHHAVDEKVNELGSRGIRSMALARMDEQGPLAGKWRFLGILTFSDPPRPDTKHTIERCHYYGVRVKMITGDHLVIAKETARVLEMCKNLDGTPKVARIYTAQGLPMLEPDGSIPEGLVPKYGNKICPADGFASVFPEHKYLIVETLRQAGFRCGMTGDGVNDAPALKKADVGIAVQGATDAARAAADLVLTAEGLSTIIEAIEISREIFQRLKNFISYRIAATLQLLTFFFISVFAFPPEKYYEKSGFFKPEDPTEFFAVPRRSSYCPQGFVHQQPPLKASPFSPGKVAAIDPRDNLLNKEFYEADFNNPEKLFEAQGCRIQLPICENKKVPLEHGGDGVERHVCQAWPAFFQLPVLMLMLITLLNDGALISIGYDHVVANPIPEQWNLARLFIVASVMGAVAMGSSLLLLAAALDSNNPNGIFAGMGLPPIEYGQVITMIYLKVSLSDFLTLFSCRTQEGFFWTVPPGKPLMGAVMISLGISTGLASAWPKGHLDGLPVMGLVLGDYTLLPLWVWIYCIIWWFIQDILKVITLWVLNHFNILPNFLADMTPYEQNAVET